MTSHQEMAEQLSAAQAEGKAITAPTRQVPSLTLEDAYAIQRRVVELRRRPGGERAGWKLGLTSAGPGTEPISGVLLDDMVLESGSRVDPQRLVAPRVEGELAVILGEALSGQVDLDGLLGGPHRVAPALEVIDYRTVDHRGPVDWVADNSTVAYAVVGDPRPLDRVDLAEVEVVLKRGGEPVATGRGSRVMGHPLRAVAWLSRHLLDRGERLAPGDVVLTGSLTGHHPVEPGAAWEADFGRLGSVLVRFEAG